MSRTHPQMPRAVDPVEVQSLLAEVQREHDNTWQMQRATNDARDMLLKMHGGALAVLPIVIGISKGQALHITPAVATLLVLVGAAFLTWRSWDCLRNTTYFRMLQFRQDHAKHIAEDKLHALGASRSGFYGSDWVRPLNRVIGYMRGLRDGRSAAQQERNTNTPQRDPMAFACSTVLHLFSLDVLATTLIATDLLLVGIGVAEFGEFTATVVVVALVTGLVFALTTSICIFKYISNREQATRRSLERRTRRVRD